MQGGEYEFAPFIRGKKKGEENFEEVARLFDGSYDNNIVKDAEEGTLNLFNGERYSTPIFTICLSMKTFNISNYLSARSLHRVRAVYGSRKRIIAILSYHTQPGRSGSPRY